jgi:hypothetical protein
METRSMRKRKIQPDITDYGHDALRHIFDFLDKYTLVKSMEVSKTWKSIVASCKSKFETLHLGHLEIYCGEEVDTTFEPYYDFCRAPYDDQSLTSHITSIMNSPLYRENLRRLYLCDWGHLMRALMEISFSGGLPKNLSEIYITRLCLRTSSEKLLTIARFVDAFGEKFRYLGIDDWSTPNGTMHRLALLESLPETCDIGAIYDLTDADMENDALIKRFKHINFTGREDVRLRPKSLDISNCKHIDDTRVSVLSEVEHIRFSWEGLSSIPGIVPLCPKLRRVSAHFCEAAALESWMDDVGFDNTLSALSHVKTLKSLHVNARELEKALVCPKHLPWYMKDFPALDNLTLVFPGSELPIAFANQFPHVRNLILEGEWGGAEPNDAPKAERLFMRRFSMDSIRCKTLSDIPIYAFNCKNGQWKRVDSCPKIAPGSFTADGPFR